MSDKPYHVLITRLSAIGDCVLTLPVASGLKQAIPDVKITWCVSCAADQLLRLCPDVDEVIRVDRRWLSSPKSWRAIRNQLRAAHIDCVVDPQSLTKSAALGWLSGAPMRIGFEKPRGRELAPFLQTHSVSTDPDDHLVDAQLKLLDALDVSPSEPKFQLNLPESATSWAAQQMQSLCPSGRPLGINPGAGWDSRIWPAQRFGQVAQWAMETHGVPSIVVWAGPKELQMAKEICEVSKGAAVLAPDSRLDQLAALLAQCRLLLTGDTGPMHIAAAIGTACLSMHGPTNPCRSGPYGRQHRSIYKQALEGSSRVRRGADNSAMLAIQVDDVCKEMGEMLVSPALQKAA